MTNSERSARFDRLRRRAKRWLRELRAGDAAALARLEQVLPRHSDPPVLREVQQAVAREAGFPDWAALKEHCALAPAGEAGPESLVPVFLEHACIFTPPPDFPAKWRRAERLRARHPALSTATLHTAVVCGEVEHVRALLDAEPDSISTPGGPQRWEPLLFACYGRLPNPRARERSLEMATLLLERGASPNAHFVSEDDWRLRFTALTGVLGQGEMGQPEHPEAAALARLLLERGADPNDGQALYDTHLVGDDTRWLELLAEFGLTADAPVNWHADPADAARSGSDRARSVFDYLLAEAAKNGHVRRLAWLLEHGADPDARSIYDGRSCHQHASMHGDREALRLLERYGATPAPLDGHDAFVAAARTGDVASARRALEENPQFARIGDALTDAAQRGELRVVRALLDAGVDPNATSRHGHRALHDACEHREITDLLLERGADRRALAFGGTPCAWAVNAGNTPMARYHASRSRSLLDAARSGHAELARELLETDRTCLGERDSAGNGALHVLTADPEAAGPLIDLLLAHGADADTRNDAGQTAAERLDARGADEVADLLETSASP